MIRRHYLNFETRYQIPPVLTSPMEPQPFCSHYLALPCCGSVALLFFTTLWFQFVSRMSAYCLQKKGTVWPRAKIEKHFLHQICEIEKEQVTG